MVVSWEPCRAEEKRDFEMSYLVIKIIAATAIAASQMAVMADRPCGGPTKGTGAISSCMPSRNPLPVSDNDGLETPSTDNCERDGNQQGCCCRQATAPRSERVPQAVKPTTHPEFDVLQLSPSLHGVRSPYYHRTIPRRGPGGPAAFLPIYLLDSAFLI